MLGTRPPNGSAHDIRRTKARHRSSKTSAKATALSVRFKRGAPRGSRSHGMSRRFGNAFGRREGGCHVTECHGKSTTGKQDVFCITAQSEAQESCTINNGSNVCGTDARMATKCGPDTILLPTTAIDAFRNGLSCWPPAAADGVSASSTDESRNACALRSIDVSITAFKEICPASQTGAQRSRPPGRASCICANPFSVFCIEMCRGYRPRARSHPSLRIMADSTEVSFQMDSGIISLTKRSWHG